MSERLIAMVELVRDELAQDVPCALETIEQWRRAPDDAAEHAHAFRSMLERGMQASALLGMDGLAGYLQILHDGVGAQSQFPSPNEDYLQWLSCWHECVGCYLGNAGTDLGADAVIDHLVACPVAVDEDVLFLLGAMLAQPPRLPDDQPADGAADSGAMLTDTSLSTEGLDADLLSALLADAPQQLERLAAIVDHLGQATAAHAQQVLEGQRIAHTLKGSALIVGVSGIGNLSHHLEDVLEFAFERCRSGGQIPSGAVRDMARAVSTLDQMVGYLQGADAEPTDAPLVLQRLLDWIRVIREGGADAAAFDPVLGGQMDLAAGSIRPEVEASLRIGMAQIGALTKRAGQSVIQFQRLTSMVSDSQLRLRDMQLNHVTLTGRLRELEMLVERQVVELRSREEGFDPLEMDRYDAVHTLSRFITEAVNDQQELTRGAAAMLEGSAAVLERERHSLREQHRGLIEARLVPVRTIVPRLKRNVDQTSSATGKEVRMEVLGEQTTLDADVLSRLTEPLLHLIRNAVDHGIEPPEQREAAGKPRSGLVKLHFQRQGRDVEVVCEDDGQGLDLPAIRAKAIEYGLVRSGEAVSDAQAARLILKPGFSTKGSVTEVSGRGVGMDVVNDRIASLKGRLEITSQPGLGTRMVLRVPATAGFVHAVIVRCAGEFVAIPSEHVVQAVAAGVPHAESVGHAHMSDLLGWDRPEQVQGLGPRVIVRASGGDVAMEVQAVVESRELILQDVGRLVRRIPGVIAASMRSDGNPLLVLDLPLLQQAGPTSANAQAGMALRQRMQIKRTRVLVVDDSLSVRRTMEQLLRDNGYEAHSASDGFEALEKFDDVSPAIVITDLEMPNLNGLELTKRLRAANGHDQLPIIMVTSRISEKHRELAGEAGVSLYLGKPYTDRDLLARLRQFAAGPARSPAQLETAGP